MFADIFNKLLKEHAITPLHLAVEIGVPKSVVYEWKKGIREPSLENLRRLADYFGVSLDYLNGVQPADLEEEELIVMLREAKRISPHDHEALLRSFKKNLSAILRANEHDDDRRN